MIYIVLPVHNRKQVTEKFIMCLTKQTYNKFRLIVVDDGSTDGTGEMVLSYLPESVVLEGDGNLWWGGALQKGYEWLVRNAKDDDICLLINDDTFFDENFLKTAFDIISKNQKTLLLAQGYNIEDNSIDGGINFDFKRLTFKKAKNISDINCLSTRGLFLRVGDFKIIGGFRPKLLPHYLSDYEFTIRAYRKGFFLTTDGSLKLFFSPNTSGFHKIEYKSVIDYYSQLFSKKNPSNPFYMLIFIILVVPFPYKIYHISRIFFKFLKDIVKPLLNYELLFMGLLN